MYVPAHFEETRSEVLHQLIHDHPLAALVTLGADGLNANHIPLELEPGQGVQGTLRGHVARANPMWRDAVANVEALAIFQGPQRYITPSWYPGKAETGKVVPTWNYAVVHARGPLRFIDDREWLRAFVTKLTARHESTREMPWSVSDAPKDYIDTLLRSIVGLEMPVTMLTGKWKVSQNRNAADRQGVVDGLTEMAALVARDPR